MADIFNYILGTVRTLISGKDFKIKQLERKSVAISKLRHAIRMTKQHIDDFPSNEFRGEWISESASKELSKLWSEAAMAIRPINSNTAFILEEKSDYWVNPKKFRQDAIDYTVRIDMRMRLEEVEQVLNQLESKK